MPSTAISSVSRPVFVAVAMGSLATVMAATTMPIALPRISAELHTSLAASQWVVTGYLLALCGGIALSAWAVARHGARRAWLTAISVFCLGSVASGLADSLTTLVASRVVAGLGAALMLPISQVILTTSAGPDHVARALSLLAIVNLLAPTFGPLVGGATLDVLGWKATLVAEVPLAIVAIALGWRALPRDAGDRTVRLDITGFVLLVATLASLTFAAARVASNGGVDLAAAGAAAGGVVIGAAFAWSAWRRGPNAVLDIAALRSPAVGSSAMIVFGFGALLFGGLFAFPLFWEARGAAPVEGGLLLVAQGLGSFVVLALVGGLTRHFEARSLAVVGLVVAALATLPFALGPSRLGDLALVCSLFARGVGLSLVLTPVLAAALGAATARALPVLSMALNIALRLGASIGTAVLAAVLGQRHGAPGAFSLAFGLLSLGAALLVLPAMGLGALPRQPSRGRTGTVQGGAQ